MFKQPKLPGESGFIKMSSYVLRLFWLLTITISGLVVYDINNSGSFAGSQVDLLLKEPWKYSQQAVTRFRSYSQQAYRWSKKNAPKYISQTREACILFLKKSKEVLATLILQIWNNIKLFCQYFLDTKPIIMQWMNRNAPGLLESIFLWLSRIWILVCDCLLQLAALVGELLSAASQWLRDNVFVFKESTPTVKPQARAIHSTKPS